MQFAYIMCPVVAVYHGMASLASYQCAVKLGEIDEDSSPLS